jgi:hypothetical protein
MLRQNAVSECVDAYVQYVYTLYICSFNPVILKLNYIDFKSSGYNKVEYIKFNTSSCDHDDEPSVSGTTELYED